MELPERAMLQGSNPNQIRKQNRTAVLEVIRSRAPVTRIEIATLLGITAPTVTNVVAELLEEGLVVETGRRPARRGQPPIELDVNADSVRTVGFHLDRDVLTGVLVNLKGDVLAATADELPPPTPERAMALLLDRFDALTRAAGVGRDRILGVGVVTVGPLDVEGGRVSGPPNFPGWTDVPLRDRLAEALSLPVFLDNNATAAAIGETWYGVGRAFADFVYVYLGLGIGGGVVRGGRIQRGAGMNAGEIGHVLVGEPPVTLESVASLLALRRDLGEAYAERGALADAFGAGDARLRDWLDASAAVMARAVVSVDHVLDVEAVIVGGRLPGNVLAHYVERVAHHAAPLRMQGRPSSAVVVAGRVGDDTAALGAATLPTYDAFIPGDRASDAQRREGARTPGGSP